MKMLIVQYLISELYKIEGVYILVVFTKTERQYSIWRVKFNLMYQEYMHVKVSETLFLRKNDVCPSGWRVLSCGAVRNYVAYILLFSVQW